MSKDVKLIRGQIRQIVKELLPELLTQELTTAIYKQLAGELGAKLEVVSNDIKRQLNAMDERSKDVQSFIMREMLSNIQTKPVEQPQEAQASDQSSEKV
jgi:hypothetical protein